MQTRLQTKCLGWIVILSLICYVYGSHNGEHSQHLESNLRRLKRGTGERQKQNQAAQKPAKTTSDDDDDDKKTLAQQVADGKYSLIQKELFSKPPKRPGILSYEINPEVPRDNVNNLGGLQPEEIWLAENHLLVLKGGGFDEKNQLGSSVWPPIDNYVAPKRQVKIPANPKVPPPFPVQLTDGGPLEFIRGKNQSGAGPFQGQRFPPPFPFHFLGDNSTRGSPLPFFPPLPPPGNFTDLDEDDPRIYYPPPYDFVFPKDNATSHVPAGPLVPGIVLPPPPDFFAPLNQKSKNRTSHQPSRTGNSRKPNKSRTMQFTPKPRTTTSTTTVQPSTTVAPPPPPPPPLPPALPPVQNDKNTKTTHAPVEVTTNRNTVKNEMAAPKVVTHNFSSGGWIPIPAPTPRVLATLKGIRLTQTTTKPHQIYKAQNVPPTGTHLLQNVSAPLPSYNRGKQYFKVLKEALSPSLPFTNVPKANYYPTTPIPYGQIKPLIVNIEASIGSTLSPKYPYPLEYSEEKKIKELYFYKDPYEIEPNTYTTRKPNQEYFTNSGKTNYETNTLVPPKLFDNFAMKVAPNAQKVEPVRVNYYDQRYLRPQSPLDSTLHYLYYSQDPKYEKDQGFSYNFPTQSQQTYKPRPLRLYNVQDNRNYDYKGTTTKPPIYEYSFSAPGYGNSEAPKISTTPKPIELGGKRPQYSYYEYQSTPKGNVYEESTASPQLYASQKPNYAGPSYSQLTGIFQTESPFNAFFTRDARNMDDITKKYFTLFGQKLNPEEIQEALTTPLPPNSQVSQKKPFYEEAFRSVTSVAAKDKKPNVNYQQEQYRLPTSNQYYKTQEFHIHNYKLQLGKPQASLHNIKYQNFYPTAIPHYEQYDYDQGMVHPNHPLTSDIAVNYQNPPPINPDAEQIDPHIINGGQPGGNTYISYQLPGSGGHFYFLTPRSVENYNLANSGIQYPNERNTDRHKVTPINQTQRRRRKRPEKVNQSVGDN